MKPLDALQDVLAGEHAALYVYGVLGGQVSRSTEPDLADLIGRSWLDHRRRRDRVSALVIARDGHPVAAAPAYDLPNAAASTAQLRAVARLVESRCVALYAQLVGNSNGRDRAWAITALDEAAVSELAYGAEPTDFPGSSD